jgi:hypothetical protein
MFRMALTLLMVPFYASIAAALPGSGTQENPWRIESLADFDEFAADPNYWAGYTRLETDVNLAGRTYTSCVIASPWISWFGGVFDGNGHKVMGLTIAGGGYYVALFGAIISGQVNNLGLEGGSVSGTGHYIGSLVGENRGIVSNCYFVGDVNGYCDVGGLVGSNFGGTVSNCYSTSSDVSGVYAVGGLVGSNANVGGVSSCYSTSNVNGVRWIGGLVGSNQQKSIISNCYSRGSVRGSDSVGGLVGTNFAFSNVSNCYSTGDVSGDTAIGGLAGFNHGNASNCYSTGDVSGTADYVGGLLGGNGNTSNVWNCYSTGDVNGLGDYVGGLLGRNFEVISNCFWDTDTQTHGVSWSIGYDEGTATNVVGLPTIQMQTKSTFTNACWDFVDIWDLTCEGISYPRFIWQIPSADFVCPHGVDFRDYSFFANHWMNTNCGDANDCNRADFDFSDKVDIADLRILCGHWLEGRGN